MIRKTVYCSSCGSKLLIDERKKQALCKNCGDIIDVIPASDDYEPENKRAKETFVEKFLRYSCGKTTLIIVAAVIAFIFFVAGLSASSARRRAAEKRAAEATATEAETEAPEEEADEEEAEVDEAEAEDEDDSDDADADAVSEDQALGTYVGANGSVLILQDYGLGQYYYSSYDNMNSLNTWSYEDGVLEVYVGSCFSTVVATIDDDFSSFTLIGKEDLDKEFWDAEDYVKVSDNTETLTAEECDELIAAS